MAEWKVDFTGDTEESLDQVSVLPGWYRAKVESCKDDDKSGAMVVSYRITGPSFANAVIHDKVWNPDNAETQEKAEKTLARAKKVMGRLGLVGKDDLGREKTISWQSCVGREMVLNVIDDSFEGKDGKMVPKVSCGYLGMFPVDHVGIPPAERQKMGLTLLPGQTLDDPKKDDKKPATRGSKTSPAAAPSAPAANVNATEFANI